MTTDPRLIEVAFPLKQTSLDSVHEKNVRHGHISTLHIWPARRPLAACRAALIATLLPDPGNAEERKRCWKSWAAKWSEGQEAQDCRRQGREKIVEETEGGILHWGRESEPRPGLVPREDPGSLRRAGPEGARPLCRRRRHPAGGDAPGLRGHGHGHQPGGLVHPQMHAGVPAEAGRADPAAARFRSRIAGVHGGLLQGPGLKGGTS